MLMDPLSAVAKEGAFAMENLLVTPHAEDGAAILQVNMFPGDGSVGLTD
jgi:hypothetical protein